MGESSVMSDCHNYFKECLAKSEENEPLIAAMVRSLIRDVKVDGKVIGDCLAQRQGVDRFILTGSNRDIRIDIKNRQGKWEDFALEYEHVYADGRRQPGWINKPLTADYIIYLFEPVKKGFLLPFDQLQQAWVDNQDRWLRDFVKKPARNPKNPNAAWVYKSWNVFVPIKTVVDELAEAVYVQLGPNLKPLCRREHFQDLGLRDFERELAELEAA